MTEPTPPPRKTRVALLQMNAGTDAAANMAQLERLAGAGADAGAEVLLVPEAFAFIGPNREKQAILEPLPAGGPLLSACRELAVRHRAHLVLGGFHERLEDPDRSANTLVHILPDGRIGPCYRKIHLFDVDLPDGTRLQESRHTAAGAELVLTDLPFGRTGLSICYDLRFPELYQALTEQGAIALLVPAAFTATTGAAHWHALLRARAIECQSWVLAPAQYGAHHGGRRSYGHSLVVDPWGEIVAEAGAGEACLIADVEPARVAEVRRQLPSLQHRRLRAGMPPDLS